MSLQLAGQIVVEEIFYSSLGFVIAVSVFWPWWRSQLGWSICAKALAFGLAFTPAMVMYTFGAHAPTWMQWGAVCSAALVGPILAWRAWVIWHAQRKARDIL